MRRTIARLGALVFFGLIVTLFWATPGGTRLAGIGSNQGPGEARDSAYRLPVAIDGAKTPDSVPDRIARIHFVLANAEQDPPSSLDLVQRSSLQADVGLDDVDTEALGLALRGVRDSLESIRVSRSAWLTTSNTSSQQAVRALKLQEDRLLDEAWLRLNASLSADGQDQLANYLRDNVKRHVVIYGDAQ